MLPHDCPGHLADVDIAARVDGDSVRRDKLARLLAGMNVAETRKPLARLVVNVDPVAEVRRVFVHAQTWTQLADEANRIVFRYVHIERTRPMHVVPLGLV